MELFGRECVTRRRFEGIRFDNRFPPHVSNVLRQVAGHFLDARFGAADQDFWSYGSSITNRKFALDMVE